MTRGFDVAITERDGARVVRVSGEVDLDSSPRLWQELQRALHGTKCVKVDLGAVAYMDSSGVATLIQGLKHAGKRKVDFRLLDPSARVMAVLELAQLPKRFTIERSEPPS
jgi:anti-sigma B factor antagonist